METSITTKSQILTAQGRLEDKEMTPIAIAPILCLHPSLRHRIYLHLNILARYPDQKHAILNLNGGNCEPSYYAYKPEHRLGFYGLLVCCQTIYAEVSALLYGSNRFIIRYWEKQSLLSLRNLSPSSLSNLKHLKIVLNQSSCHHRDPTWFEDCSGVCDDERGSNKESDRENESNEVFGSGLHDTPLDIRESGAKALLDEWHSIAEHLSRHVSPQNLELCIVCDVRQGDFKSAREVVEPIGLFPELRNCHIRLSRNYEPQLRQIAHDAVLKARHILSPLSSRNVSGLAPSNKVEETSQPKLQTGCRLLTLPRELRFRILSYTDLITPWKQVEWSRGGHDGGKYLALYPRCGILEGLSCQPHIHYGCQFFNCWAAGNLLSKAGIGCFCQVRHSAASSTCMCWAPPTALFLVGYSKKHLLSSFRCHYHFISRLFSIWINLALKRRLCKEASSSTLRPRFFFLSC